MRAAGGRWRKACSSCAPGASAPGEVRLSSLRLMAIGLIYLCTAVAWSTLGASVVSRTGESDAQLSKEVAQLWGGRHNQVAPLISVLRPRTVTETVVETDKAGQPVKREVTKTVPDAVGVPLRASRVEVGLDLQHRQKGLLWYDTYAVLFSGRYRLRNPDDQPRTVTAEFRFPSGEALYDGFVFRLAGRDATAGQPLAQALVASTELPAHGEADLEIAYRSRGLDDWTYSFAPQGVSHVEDFTLDLTTDFRAIDFPAGTMSPTTKTAAGSGWRLGWRFDSLVTGQKVGVDLPNRLNPGPVAARITFFAPVSLLFFLTVMVILGVLSGRSLHPMNYFFLSAAFFAFHLLLAYLVDHLPIHASFLIASAVSLFLVVSYLRRVAGLQGTTVREAALAQLVYLVLFSYAFFFEGYTGLTVTIGAVVTLFVLMQITARVDWEQVFARPVAPIPPPAPIPPRRA
jgi:inner membrane protein involved in colicin E2 resistance